MTKDGRNTQQQQKNAQIVKQYVVLSINTL